jgi:hypothetical protein
MFISKCGAWVHLLPLLLLLLPYFAVRPFMHAAPSRLAAHSPCSRCAALQQESAEAGSEFAVFDEEQGIDLESSMSSVAPEWQQESVPPITPAGLDASTMLYPPSSYPKLSGSQAYFNGSAPGYWWNQNSESVRICVPIGSSDVNADPPFSAELVDFKRSSRRASLSIGGQTIFDGKLMHTIDAQSSLWYADMENQPPFVGVELFKLREYMNWKMLLQEEEEVEDRQQQQ